MAGSGFEPWLDSLEVSVETSRLESRPSSSSLLEMQFITSVTEGEGGYVFTPFCVFACLFVCLCTGSQKVVDGTR